jgi:hypothetical protein
MHLTLEELKTILQWGHAVMDLTPADHHLERKIRRELDRIEVAKRRPKS